MFLNKSIFSYKTSNCTMFLYKLVLTKWNILHILDSFLFSIIKIPAISDWIDSNGSALTVLWSIRVLCLKSKCCIYVLCLSSGYRICALCWWSKCSICALCLRSEGVICIICLIYNVTFVHSMNKALYLRALFTIKVYHLYNLPHLQCNVCALYEQSVIFAGSVFNQSISSVWSAYVFVRSSNG